MIAVHDAVVFTDREQLSAVNGPVLIPADFVAQIIADALRLWLEATPGGMQAYREQEQVWQRRSPALVCD